MTPIAEVLKPYTLYLIYAQIFLLSLAIFVGSMLIIRRLWRREAVDGGLIQDREKLAAEIHEEMLRLQDLRNRLDSSYVLQGKDVTANPIPRALSGSAVGVPGSNDATPGATAVAGALNQVELEAKVHEATQYLAKEVAELTEKLSRAEDGLKNAAPADAASQNADQTKTANELRELRDKLEDYQAFEDEIALVKQYKAEIERLKAQLDSAPGTKDIGISEDDIASLFAEMGSGSVSDASADDNPIAQETTPSSDGASEKTVFKASPSPKEDPFAVLLASEAPVKEEDLVFAADATAARADAPPRKGYVNEARSEEPSLPPISEDNAEALAELGEDDQLMAEFEKVLNTKDQEK
ncbi:MAG: hypothetical protein ABIR96_12585 [Bdellovibrionota bacterium]